MTYANLGLVQPPFGDFQGIGKRRNIGPGASGEAGHRIIPFPEDPSTMAPLVDAITGEKFTFKTQHELGRFKYQRFMQRYLRCVQYVVIICAKPFLLLVYVPETSTNGYLERLTTMLEGY